MDCQFSPSHLAGRTVPPASKSETHRRLICAGLSRETSTLEGLTASQDTVATMRCLRALGADISGTEGTVTVRGFARRPELLPVLDCGESASTLRFFVPVAMVLAHGGIFRMHGRLSQRPMDIYRELFVPRGVLWRMREGADGAAELTVTGDLGAGNYVLPGNVSSQFVSGLLFALPMLDGDSTLKVLPPIESASYIAMTVRALREGGIEVRERENGLWEIPGRQRYHAQNGVMQADWSQAAVLLCMDALGAEIGVEGVNERSIQGDRAVLAHLEALGAEIVREDGCISVKPGELHGAELDLHDTPDIAPILALVCQLAKGESRLTGCGRLRLKECDRLAATVRLLNALGGDAREEGDTIAVRGVERLRGGVTVDGCHDHRMVMLLSAAASVAQQPVTVQGVEALEKSWPDYLDVYRALGGKAE